MRSRLLVLALLAGLVVGCGDKDSDAPLKVEGAPGAPPASQSNSGLQLGDATTPPIPGK